MNELKHLQMHLPAGKFERRLVILPELAVHNMTGRVRRARNSTPHNRPVQFVREATARDDSLPTNFTAFLPVALLKRVRVSS